MSWFSRLFSRREPEAAPVRAPFAIPLPEGYGPKWLERPRPPKRNLKKFTAEEIAADDNRYKKKKCARSSCKIAGLTATVRKELLAKPLFGGHVATLRLARPASKMTASASAMRSRPRLDFRASTIAQLAGADASRNL